MNIIQANKHYYQRSGADRYIFNLTDLLEQHGHNVIPFAMQHRENLRSPWDKFFPSYVQTRVPRIGLGALRTVGRGIYSFEAREQMRLLIRESRPDLAHIHNIYAQLSPSILDALRDRDIPTVMTVHDYHLVAPNYMLWSHNRIENWGKTGLIRTTLSRFHKDSLAASFAQALTYKLHRWRFSYQRGIDRFICPSEFVRQQMIKGGFAEDRVVTIPHFLVPPKPSQPPYILFVGRLVTEKGAEVLLHAMRELPNVKCKILGDGPDMKRLREWARDMPNVEFLGWRSGEPAWYLYQNARAVVVPSLWYEVFGLVALEAMAAGTVVIASDIGGLTEVVEDGVTGRLFPAGDVEALRAHIVDMIEDPDRAQEMGQAGRKKVETEFNPELHYQRIMEVYRNVM